MSAAQAAVVRLEKVLGRHKKGCETCIAECIGAGQSHVMSGRWVDTMKIPTMWRSKYTARSYEERQLLCNYNNNTGHPHAFDKVSRQTRSGTRSFCGHKLFSTLREGEQLYAQPPEGWVSEHLRDAGKNICRASSKNMVSSSTSTKTFVSANSSRDPTHSVSKNLTTMTLFWTNFEQRRHRKLLGELPWMDHPDIKNAVCQLSTHVGTTTSTTSRDEISIKRLLR